MQRNTYFMDEVITNDKLDVRYLKRLLSRLLPRKKAFFTALILLALSSVVALLPPVLIREIVERVIPAEEGKMRMFALYTAGLGVLGVLTAVLPYFHKKIMGVLGNGIIAEVRREIFYRLQELPFEYYDARPAGKISIRVTDYINELTDFFTEYLLNFIVDLLKIFVGTVFMLVMSPLLTAVVYAAIVPLTVCIFLLKRAIRKLYRYQRAKSSNRNAFIVESIMGEKVIKNNNRSQYNRDVYRVLQDDCAKTWMRIVRRNELNAPVSEIFWNLGTLLIYTVALALIYGGNAAMAGTVIAFLLYMGLCSEPFMQISAIMQQLAQVSANLERIYETVDAPATICDKKDAVVLNAIEGRVDFDGVTFGYDEGINVLENFDLHVAAGEKIALVGPTGAGKTTVINLLTRFYDVNEGSVRIDGNDVRDVTLRSLRKEIGVLMQETFIFKGSVLDNIRYGTPEATDEECIAAAEKICADRVEKRLPTGYHTLLGERGEGLSAGERQLISFARIVLKNPKIVILDEATSSIDSETELLIQSALDTVLAGKTAFIVAHRLSTIRKADRILYIADKGIAEQGSHEALMKLKGRYYSLNGRTVDNSRAKV